MSEQGEGRGAQERMRFLPLLGAAARQLLDLEKRWINRPDAVSAEIERRLEACAWVPRDRASEQLVLLLRLRDLNRYVEAETEHRAFKLAVLDAASRQREPARRWEAIRNLLLAHLPKLLDVRGEQVTGALKRDVSSAGSPLGQMLRLSALLNLEAAGECPPPAVALRFARGRFPEHAWEPRAGKAGGGSPVWQPVAPLARWEYLAVDLMEHACRSPAGAKAEWAGRSGNETRGQAGLDESTYCRLDGADGNAMQLSLLPTQRETLLGELMGHARRALGPEGVRQIALILMAAAEASPGNMFMLDRARLVALCQPMNPRAARESSRKLEAALEWLCRAVVDRIGNAAVAPDSPISGTEQMRSTRLLTILERHGGHPGQPGGHGNQRVERWTVLADRILWNPSGRPLGESLRILPMGVIGLPPRQYPYALALAALLASWFDEQPGASLERSIQGLALDGGLAIDRSKPHKMAETMKRDLHALIETGVLSGWRVVSRKTPILETILRLDPPRHWNAQNGERGIKAKAKRSSGQRARAVWRYGNEVAREVAETTIGLDAAERRVAP